MSPTARTKPAFPRTPPRSRVGRLSRESDLGLLPGRAFWVGCAGTQDSGVSQDSGVTADADAGADSGPTDAGRTD